MFYAKNPQKINLFKNTPLNKKLNKITDLALNMSIIIHHSNKAKRGSKWLSLNS